MEAVLLPRTGDAFVVVVTDDYGAKHRVHYWPMDDDAKGERATEKAIEYVKHKSAGRRA